MPSGWSMDQDESNHGFRFHLYYLYVIFDLAGVIASNQSRRKIPRISKRKRWSLARDRCSQGVTPVHMPFAPVFKHACTPAQMAKAWGCEGNVLSSIPGHDIWFFYMFCIFSIFSYFIWYFAFILISFHNFLSCIKNHQQYFKKSL